jgi:hypothetical protein
MWDANDDLGEKTHHELCMPNSGDLKTMLEESGAKFTAS